MHAELSSRILTAIESTEPRNKDDILSNCKPGVVITMKDLQKLRISESEERDLRILWDQAVGLQYKCKKLLQDNVDHEFPEKVTNNLGRLKFEKYLSYTNSRSSRKTNAGIFCDDLQKFVRFQAAVEMAKGSCSEEVRTISEQLDLNLCAFTSRMKRVLIESEIPLPHPEDLDDLKEQLDKATRDFLKFFEKESREQTDGDKIKESDVDIVRNYVVLRTFHDTLLLFDTDLGKIIE